MLVKDMMTRDVITVSEEASLKDVGRILKEKKISGIPVVNKDGVVSGVITMTDMLRVLSHIYEWKEIEKSNHEVSLSDEFEKQKTQSKVEDVMTKEVTFLAQEDTLDDVMKLMFEKKIHTIPVMKDGELLGVIGKRDLIATCF